MQILSPIPDAALPAATRLWWRHFGLPRPCPVLRMRAGHGIAALDGSGNVLGVLGLRDAAGGFPASRLPLPLFRAAPPTADLVIDGIAVRRMRRGTGRALVARALLEAEWRGHPGLRAEVRLRNCGALEFWRRLGFAEIARGRFGWPWTGQVVVLRRPVEGA